MIIRCSLIFTLLSVSADAFAPAPRKASSNTVAHSFWRHWIPETDPIDLPFTKLSNQKQEQLEIDAQRTFLSSCFALLLLLPFSSWAVSGGGLDYAGLDISGQDYSNSNYKGKDFTQVIAKGANFAKSNLQGCRFYKAYLVSIPLGSLSQSRKELGTHL